MSSHLADSAIYGHLWTTPELHDLFDDRGRTSAWLTILAALAQAQADVGLVPAEAAALIAEHATIDRLDLAVVAEGTRSSGHSTHGLIRHLREILPAAGARVGVLRRDRAGPVRHVVRLGPAAASATSSNGTSPAATPRTVALARRHRDTVMCGRTHGQPGLPVTFGFKAAVWASELARHRERLAQLRPRVEVVQLGGALGTMEFWGEQALPLLDGFAARLGLGAPDIPWITARDRVAEFLAFLALVTGTLAKIGNEVFELQRPEIGEVGEPIVAGTVGSITMPHKRNPEFSEQLDTLARVVRADADVALEGLVALHERDGRSWKAEWLVLPEACQLTGAALGFGARLLEGLRVDAERMRANLDAHGAAMTSEPLMAVLAARIGKHSAHDAVYAAAMAARDAGTDLGEQLVAEGLLTKEEVAAATDPTRALGAVGAFVDRVTGA